MFCPQAVDWEVSGIWAGVAVAFVAAIATFAAVVVALKSTDKALAHAQAMRDLDAAEKSALRALKARAYATVVVHHAETLSSHLDSALRQSSNEGVGPKVRLLKALSAIGRLQTGCFDMVLEQVDVFDEERGECLAKLVASVSHLSSHVAALEKLAEGPVSSENVDSIRRVIDGYFLRIRKGAVPFYDTAQFPEDKRSLRPLTSADEERLAKVRARSQQDAADKVSPNEQ